MNFVRLIAFALVLAAFVAQSAVARSWTDQNGKVIEADLMGVKSGLASLKLASGKIIKVQVTKLSEADQAFVKQADTAAPATPAKKGPGDAAAAGSEPAAVMVAGLTINKIVGTDPDGKTPHERDIVPRCCKGTEVCLFVATPKEIVLAVDEAQSKLTQCNDDTGQDLTKPDRDYDQTGGHAFAHERMLFERPKAGGTAVTTRLPRTPAPGAKQIHLAGELVIRVGSGEKHADQADVSLRAASEVTVGPVPIMVQPGTPSTEYPSSVVMEAKKSDFMIKNIEFFDAAGKPIRKQPTEMGVNEVNGERMMVRYIDVQTTAEKVTVRVTWFDKVETRRVPFDIEFGVGL